MPFEKDLRDYVRKKCAQYKSDKLLPLVMPTFGEEEILEAFDSMVNLKVTMGPKVRQFESDFSNYLGVKYSSMVNSGSSANLLALSVLSNPALPRRIMPGDEIIAPAVTWSTTIFPILNVGAKPVMADVDSGYLIDIEQIKELITPKTRAIMPVHLLGNVCDMKAISEIAQDKKLFVIEDTCEALGSEFGGKKAGALSDISTFSFYFSHHITTAEGGMVCTSSEEYADLARILRAHGYIRDSLHAKEYAAQNPSIDPRFLFVNTGYNFRATDIQAAFGIHQLKKLDGFIAQRRKAAQLLLSGLKQYEDYLVLPREKPLTRHSWFAFAITIKENKHFNCRDLMSHLEANGIETRPVVGGNLAEQPAFKYFNHRSGNLKNAKNTMRNAFYFGIHPNMGDETVRKVCGVFDGFFSKIKR